MTTNERGATAVRKVDRSVMTLTIKTMITLTILIKDSSSHQGPNTEPTETKTSTEVETKGLAITGTGEDSVMKEVEADHKILQAVNLSKAATQIKIDSSLPHFHHIAVKCTDSRISRECSKASCCRNKLGR